MKFFVVIQNSRLEKLTKFLAVTAALSATLTLGACGGKDESTSDISAPQSLQRSRNASKDQRSQMSREEIARLPQFKIRAMHRPAPRHLVVEDVRKGSGIAMKPGDTILVDFGGTLYGYSYKTTPKTRNPSQKFSFEEIMPGWQKGLPGMRVGGRRELIVPSRLGSANAPAIYQVDLLAVYPGG